MKDLIENFRKKDKKRTKYFFPLKLKEIYFLMVFSFKIILFD